MYQWKRFVTTFAFIEKHRLLVVYVGSLNTTQPASKVLLISIQLAYLLGTRLYTHISQIGHADIITFINILVYFGTKL